MADFAQMIISWLTTYWPWLVGGLFLIFVIFLIRGLWGGYMLSRRRTDLEERVGEIEAEPSQGVFGALTPALAAQIPESERESTEFRSVLRPCRAVQSQRAFQCPMPCDSC